MDPRASRTTLRVGVGRGVQPAEEGRPMECSEAEANETARERLFPLRLRATALDELRRMLAGAGVPSAMLVPLVGRWPSWESAD